MKTNVYIIENLDCANCAAKAEEKIRKIPGVADATIVFSTRQLRLTAEDPDGLLPQVHAAAQQVEADIRFLQREHHEHHAECGCGHHHHEHHEECGCGHHHHEHHEECGCGHHHEHHDECSCSHDHHHHSHGEETGEGKVLLLGGGLFLAGVLLSALVPGVYLHIPVFVIAYLILGLPVLKHAAGNLVKGNVFDENFLMGIATLGAFAIGEFPEAVGIMLFYRIGEYFEHRAVERSRKQIMDAVDLRPETVNLVFDYGVRTVPAEEAKVGDLLLIRPGDRIPLDGVVVSGTSRIDTAPITGEPVPVSVRPGDHVVSGCVNADGQLTVRAEKPLSESMVTRILNSVENAAASKPKIDRFITRFARVYTPVVVITALLVAVVPSVVTGNWNYWVYTALSFLVMSCPCALVLSVPLAFFSGIGVGSKQGILFKGGLAIEALSGVKNVALDKTGTLTKGDFRVQSVEGGDEILRLSACCEQASTHPIAISIVSAAAERGWTLTQPQTLEELPGHGIIGTVEGCRVACGNQKLMERLELSVPAADGNDGTWLWVALDKGDGLGMRYAGRIHIADTLKADAKASVAQLKAMGCQTAILTGDGEDTARAVARETGIDRVFARLLPEEKLTALQELRKQGGPVLFVGDGINDAPVLSGADVGAAMGSGADAAMEAADVVFLTGQTAAIPMALEIARQTRQIAMQNVIFALAVKLAVMILGLLGYASMWAAVFADSGVAMLCVLNSIRILYGKQNGK